MPHIPRAWSHTLYYSTPFSFPATDRFHEAAPPLFVEKKGLESCVVNGRSGVSRMWRLRHAAPPPRWEWKPRTIDGGSEVDGGCAAASSPRSVSSTVKVIEKVSSSLSRTTVMIRNIPNQLRYYVEIRGGFYVSCNLSQLR